MLHCFEPLASLADGQYLSAQWLNALAARSHWLFNAAHGIESLTSQPESTDYTQNVWEGTTTARVEHQTLKFSARINLVSGAIARLQYERSDATWVDLVTDSNAGLRFFGGTTWNTIGLSSLTPRDNTWHFRFVMNAPGGWAQVYCAYLTGTNGFPSWPSLPSFSDGSPVSALSLNTLRQAQEYLFACARSSTVSAPVGKFWHTQGGSYQSLARYVFRYNARKRLYVGLLVENLPTNQHVYVYLEPFSYNADAGDSRIATLYDITANGYYSLNFNLNNYSLTAGQWYAVEINAYYGTLVTVANVCLADLGGLSRTYNPKSNWQHGDIPNASQLNTIKNDINQLYPDPSRESPLYYEHLVASHHWPNNQGMFYWSERKFRLIHRWRYLKFRGDGVLSSLDGKYTYQLPANETDPTIIQTVDLELIRWLQYGMEYMITDTAENTILVAYEDYEV